MTLRRDAVDRCLESVDGVDVWYETIRGAEARMLVDGRHLRRVLAAKAKEATPHVRTVQAPLRVVRTEGKRESA